MFICVQLIFVFANLVSSVSNKKMNPSFPKKTDVVVVGAGPAGSILAYHLAKAGVDVVLLDKAKFPRGKTCGMGASP